MAAMQPPAEETEPSLYAVLNVSRDASAEDIKRAYKSLAQVFHPDKHLDDDLRDKAQEAFSKLQDAYEVLSDPQKRDVYDVYGKEGLAAGLSVGTKLKSTEELRREWEAFKAQQQRAREEAMAHHRGIYMCRVDGRGWAHGDLAQFPQIRMVVVQNSLDMTVFDSDAALLQGQAALKGHAGSGSVVAGYKRTLSPLDSLEVNAVLGLRSLLTVTSNRQLGTYTTGSLSATYSYGQGMGMQATTSRQLTAATSASLTWVIGPSPGTAMIFSMSHKGTKYAITGRLDLGFVTSLSSRLVYQFNESYSMKLGARVGTSGIDTELGLSRRFSPTTVLYAGTVLGYSSGTQFKLRYSRAGQVFEFPILLSDDYSEWQMFAAATLLPPLASFLLLRYVVRPLVAWSGRRTERKARAEQAEQLRGAAARAAAERALLAPVARRKMLSEASAGGLVVLEAAYGVLHEYRLARAAAAAEAGKQQQQGGQQVQQLQTLPQQQQRQSSPRPDTHPQPDKEQQQAAPAAAASQADGSDSGKQRPASADKQRQQRDAGVQNGTSGSGEAAAAGGSDSPDSSSGQQEQQQQEEQELPPGWLDVTEALQYLVSGGKLELPAGVSKLGLMGFADVAPQADKELYVAYCHNRQLYEKVVGDKELLRLPGAGELVCEEDAASRLWLKYKTAFGTAAAAAGGSAAGASSSSS